MIVATQYGIWILTLALQTVIGALMLRRGLASVYPCFFGYTAYSVIRSGVMFGLLHLYRIQMVKYLVYFYVFWFSEVISLILCVAVAYSVICCLFRDFDVLRRYAPLAFGVALAGLLIGAMLLSKVSGGSEQRLIGATLMLNRDLLFIQAGLVVLTAGFAAWAALPWRTDLTFGIALGFGIQASVELVAITMRSEIGSSLNVTYQILRAGSYLVAVLVWLLYIRAPQAADQLIEQPTETTDVDSWNRTLAEMLGK